MSLAEMYLSPHESLLFACTDSLLEDGNRRQIDAALSTPELDWSAVIRTAIQQGVTASLAWHLRAFHNDSRIPPAITAILERIYAAQAVRNRVQFAEAGRMTRALEQAGIPCLMLKGIALASTVYPDPAFRISADIDLLVPAEEWEHAGAIAEQAGFLPSQEMVSPLDYHREYSCRAAEDILSNCLAPEFEPKHRPEAIGAASHRVALEIHRGVFTLPGGFTRPGDLTPLWESPRTVVLPEGTIRIPGPEGMIVHLAAHAARHRYSRLMFVSDILQAIRAWQAEIDWERVAAYARCYAAQDAVFRMLELARRKFAAPVPDDFLRRLERDSSSCPDHAPLTPREIFDAMELDLKAPSAITWQRLMCERSPGQIFASVSNILFPSPSVIRRYYDVRSPLLIAGCYFIRPFQLAGRLAYVLCHIARVGWLQRHLAPMAGTAKAAKRS